MGSLLVWNVRPDKLAHLDRRPTGDDSLAPPRQCLVQVSGFQYPKTADVLLGLQVRPVGDQNLAIGLRPQRPCVAGRGEAANENPDTGGHHLLVECDDIADDRFALFRWVVVIGVVNRDQVLRHDSSFSCTYPHGRNAPGSNLPVRHLPAPRRYASDRPLGHSALKSTRIAKYTQVSLNELQSHYWLISAATSSPNFFWISFWVSGSKSVRSNIRRTSTTISSSFAGMREAHSSASSRDFTLIIQKPPTTSFVSGNGPSVTFDFPSLKVTRALIVAGGVRPSSASSTPAFPSSSLYLPISSMALKSGTQPAFAVS